MWTEYDNYKFDIIKKFNTSVFEDIACSNNVLLT